MRMTWKAPRNSLRGAKYQAKYGPPILQTLATYWQLSELEQRQWWTALTRSHWSAATTWTNRLLRFHPAKDDARAFLLAHCGPHVVISILEELVQEKCLSRRLATSIEEKVLAQMDGRVWPSSDADTLDLEYYLAEHWP